MTTAPDTDAETRAYYRARASEFDDWYRRAGAYGHGADADAAWARELREIETFLAPVRGGRVFEVAAGTGRWTRLLSTHNRVVASDYAPEMLVEARAAQPDGPNVRRLRADAYRLPPPTAAVDACFFGFWLSHVPPPRAPEFIREAARIVRPGGDLWLADSRQDAHSGRQTQRVPGDRVQQQARELNDGRRYTIWKIYWTPADLRFLLGLVCQEVEVRQTERFFILARGTVS